MNDHFDPLIDEQPARFVVGIDLGTTNSAVAYVDTQESPWQVRVFRIPQLVAPGVVEERDTLPSFHYEASTGEATDGLLRLPWERQEATIADDSRLTWHRLSFPPGGGQPPGVVSSPRSG